MNLNTAKRIAEAGEKIGNGIELREDYSGRGMYGSRTAGLVGGMSEFIQSVAQAAADMSGEPRDLVEEFVDDLGNIRTDNMGHDLIIY